jgi:hypothetical protein
MQIFFIQLNRDFGDEIGKLAESGTKCEDPGSTPVSDEPQHSGLGTPYLQKNRDFEEC